MTMGRIRWKTMVVMAGAFSALAFGVLGLWGGADANDTASDLTPYRNGVVAYRNGDYAKALTHLKQAQAAYPADANVRYYLAVVLDKLARGEEAILHYQYVSANGTDEKVVAYSRQRVQALKPAAGIAKSVYVAPKELNEEGFAVPLKPHQNALMVEARLNGQVNGTFIVDTGATYTSISRELYESLDPSQITHIGTVRITTANGRIEVPKIRLKTVSLNGLVARDVEATVIEVREGSSFSGLLGLSFIRQFKLTIDPVRGELVFQAPERSISVR